MLGLCVVPVTDTGQTIDIGVNTKLPKHKLFEQIADKEVQDREEEQLAYLQENIDEIRKLLEEIKHKQAATRGLVDQFKGQDYDLEAVYQRAREWRHARDDWSREYTPTPPPQASNLAGSEKSFLEELQEAGDTMDPVEEEEEAAEAEETAVEEAADEEADEEAEDADATETAEAEETTAEVTS